MNGPPAGADLATVLEGFRHDPLQFVKYAFPWGEPEKPLEGQTGPYAWQAEVLQEIGAALRANAAAGEQDVIQHAIASGHGVGKSALVAWVLLWGLATFRDARLTLTANTEQQLRTKTWPELAKWHGMMICGHKFALTRTSLMSCARGHQNTWRLDRVTWSAWNTVAFQGLHNKGRRIVLVFDEASAIADSVWEASEGVLTDAGTEIIWLALGNPTQNTGRFRECFGARKARWRTRQIDSRDVPGTNRKLFERWIQDYGPDSDFVRVRVKGEFPRASSRQFIPSDIVEAAALRQVQASPHEALVLGVDVARHGDDMTVIWARRGRDARSVPPLRLRVPDLMQIAAHVADMARDLRADAVFVDMGGMGAGVLDRLRQTGVPRVAGIAFGGRADGVPFGDVATSAAGQYANKRAEMWANMRAWLRWGAIPDDPEIKADLTGPEYGFNMRDEILLERKQDMKRRGLASPDLADALALTFAWPVEPRTHLMTTTHHLTDHED